MKKNELVRQLEPVPDDFEIYLEFADGSVGDFKIEPVTESCDKPDVIALIIVPKEVKH